MGVIMYKKQLYSGGSDSVSELTDVELTDLADGEILKYDATEEKWVNAEDSGSGGGSVVALPSLYSAKEKMVGLWTDNKPLYQKTFHINSFTSTSWYSIDSNFTPDLYSIKTINSNGYVVNGGGYTNQRYILIQTNGFWIRITQNNQGLQACIDGTPDSGVTRGNCDITVQYTKITDTPVEDFNLQDFGIFAPVIYSEEEREIGVWIDDKPLYQKTFDLGSDISVSNTSWYNSIVSVTNIEKISSAWGMYSGGTYYPLMAYHTNDDVNVLAARANSGASVRYLTLQYTKTTDVPGSGQYTTLGVPAVHYSTTEQVIGTWIDGKPLYQKTVEANLSNGVIYTVTDGDMVLVNEAYGVYDVSGTIQFLNLNAFFTNSDNCMIYTRGSDIYSQVTNTFKTYYTKALLTIRYTKTTD